MPNKPIGSSTTLSMEVPTRGSTNWADDIEKKCFQKIADHTHGGDGTGAVIDTSTIVLSSLRAKVDATFNASQAVTDIVDGAGDPILELSTGGAVIEYSMHGEVGPVRSVSGTLTIDHTTGSIVNEFVGDYINYVTFSYSSADGLRYANTNTTSYNFKYVIKKVQIG